MYDYLRVPEHLTPGDYVLGFRWDCEYSVSVGLEQHRHNHTISDLRIWPVTLS